MAVTTVESVASFSAVLTEAFAAVGLSTLAPAAVVTLAKALKGAAEADAAATPAPVPGTSIATTASVPVVTPIGVSVSAARSAAAAAQADAAAAAAVRAAAARVVAQAALQEAIAAAAAVTSLHVEVRPEVRAAAAAAAEAAFEASAAALAAVGAFTLAQAQVLLPQARAALMDAVAGFGSSAKQAAHFLDKMALGVDELHLLVPKTARLHAEFEFQGHESFAGSASASASVLQVVSVNTGFSALYQTSTKNRITLDVDFELAKFPV